MSAAESDNVRLNNARHLFSLPIPLAEAKDVDNPGPVIAWELQRGTDRCIVSLARFSVLLC